MKKTWCLLVVFTLFSTVSAFGAWGEWNFTTGFDVNREIHAEQSSDPDTLMRLSENTTAFSISGGVLTCTQTGPEDYLRLDIDDLAANGGGDYVNEYTMFFDLRIDALDWFPVYNTGYDNYNDAELWIRGDGAIGDSGVYTAAGIIPEATWVRLAVTRKYEDDAWYRYLYVEGNLVAGKFLGEGTDGTNSLYTNEQQDEGQFTILSDNDQWVYAGGKLQNYAFADWAMSDADIAAYGPYDGGPIGIPEPATLVLLSLGSLAILRQKRY